MALLIDLQREKLVFAHLLQQPSKRREGGLRIIENARAPCCAKARAIFRTESRGTAARAREASKTRARSTKPTDKANRRAPRLGKAASACARPCVPPPWRLVHAAVARACARTGTSGPAERDALSSRRFGARAQTVRGAQRAASIVHCAPPRARIPRHPPPPPPPAGARTLARG